VLAELEADFDAEAESDADAETEADADAEPESDAESPATRASSKASVKTTPFILL
jgi:hypothetical protein